MTIVGCLSINRTEQIELLYDLGGLEIKNFPDRPLQFFFVHFASAKCIDANTHRFRMAYRISELDLATVRQSGSDNIFCDPASHVSRAAIDFAGIFSRKRSATVPAHSAVGVANNFAPGDASVAFRAADDEPASRINQVGCFLVDPFRWHHFFDQEFDQGFADFLLFHIGCVLRRNHHGCGAYRFVAVIFDRNLGLGVGSQPRDFAGLAQSRELAPEFVRE